MPFSLNWPKDRWSASQEHTLGTDKGAYVFRYSSAAATRVLRGLQLRRQRFARVHVCLVDTVCGDAGVNSAVSDSDSDWVISDPDSVSGSGSGLELQGTRAAVGRKAGLGRCAAPTACPHIAFQRPHAPEVCRSPSQVACNLPSSGSYGPCLKRPDSKQPATVVRPSMPRACF